MNMRTEILRYLEKNSRVDLGELAVLLGTDEMTVANEIAEMEKEKIICGYHTLIDWDKTGEESVTALIEVRVTPQRDLGFDRIAEQVSGGDGSLPDFGSIRLSDYSGGQDIKRGIPLRIGKAFPYRAGAFYGDPLYFKEV